MWNQGGDGGGGIEWSEAGTNDGCAQGHTSTAVSPSQLRQCQISIIKSSVLVCAHTNSWVAWEEKVVVVGVKREGESCASPNLLPCLERVEFLE